jgi:pilus assembly protein CpaB
MALPKRSRKAWIQFGIAVVIALIFGVIAVGVIFMLFGGLNAQNSKIQKRFQQEKAALEQRVDELSKKQKEKPEAVIRQQVVVKAPDKAGEPLTTDSLEMVTLDEGKKPARNSFDDLTEVVGRIPARNLFPGEVLTINKLLNTDNMLTVATGKRAISMQANGVNLIGGSLIEGSHVDILATFKDPSQTRTILSNIRVLKAPGQSSASKSTRTKSTAGLITLETTPAEAEMLALAARTSDLHIVLRPFGDDSRNVRVNGIDIDQLAYGLQGAPPRTSPTVITQPANPVAASGNLPNVEPLNTATFTMAVYRGTSQENQTFQQAPPMGE